MLWLQEQALVPENGFTIVHNTPQFYAENRVLRLNYMTAFCYSLRLFTSTSTADLEASDFKLPNQPSCCVLLSLETPLA